MRPLKSHTNLLSLIQADIKAIDRQLVQIENNQTPTYPRQDPDTLPPVGVAGQIVVGHDDQLYTHDGTDWQLAF